MQYNPSDKSISLVADIDFLLFGNSAIFNSEYSLDDRTRNVNNVWDEAIAEMFKADPNWKWDDLNNTDLPCAIATLVGNQDHYSIPDSALVIHELRMKNSQGDFVILTPKLKREFSDSELKSTGSPDSFYREGNAIFPVPMPDYGYSAGVEISIQRGGNYFIPSDTTKKPGFSSLYHRFLSLGAALDYAIANGMTKKSAELRIQKEAMRKSMVEHFQRRAMDVKPRLKLKRKSIKRYGL